MKHVHQYVAYGTAMERVANSIGIPVVNGTCANGKSSEAPNVGLFVKQLLFVSGFTFVPEEHVPCCNWLVLSDEQMSKRWPFSLLNSEQMSNKVGVKHQPDNTLRIQTLPENS